jgi:putative ABC transport system permease protein
LSGVSFGLAQVGRELKSGEVRVLAAALALAVAAMTAVGFFTDRVAQGVQARSAEVLAADLVLRSNRPIAPAQEALARDVGLATARTASFPSVVLAGDESALADIEGVTEGYPLRGALRVSSAFDAESVTVNAVPPPGEAWADPRLLARLGAEVGQVVQLGRIELEITRLLDYRPDQGFSFAELAPTLLVNYADIEPSGLVAPGSRVSYRLLLAGNAGALADYRNRVELGVGERLRGIEDAQPEIGNAVERAGRFIGLASLVSALIAAVAVAMAARRFASRRMDTVALMKCVGAPRRFVLTAMLVQLLVVGLAASLVGLALGWLAQEGLVRILADLVGDAAAADPGAGNRRPGAGGDRAGGLRAGAHHRALPTPPGRVLRRDLLPPAAGPLVLYGAAIVGGIGLLPGRCATLRWSAGWRWAPRPSCWAWPRAAGCWCRPRHACAVVARRGATAWPTSPDAGVTASSRWAPSASA